MGRLRRCWYLLHPIKSGVRAFENLFSLMSIPGAVLAEARCTPGWYRPRLQRSKTVDILLETHLFIADSSFRKKFANCYNNRELAEMSSWPNKALL
jgi:hypothetical protein